MPNQKQSISLVDAVYDPHRAPSQLTSVVDALRDALDDTDQVDASMMMDIILLRWMLADVLMGQGYSIGQIVGFQGNPWQKVAVTP
jgi:hypothetical protein